MPMPSCRHGEMVSLATCLDKMYNYVRVGCWVLVQGYDVMWHHMTTSHNNNLYGTNSTHPKVTWYGMEEICGRVGRKAEPISSDHLRPYCVWNKPEAMLCGRGTREPTPSKQCMPILVLGRYSISLCQRKPLLFYISPFSQSGRTHS